MAKPPKQKQHYAPASAGFGPAKREWDQVLEKALKRVPAFFDSTEFKRLDPYDTALTTVVIRHFGNWFVKLQRNATLFPDNARHTRELQPCYEFIEELSSSRDPEVSDLVVSEVFYAIPRGDAVEEEVFKSLKAPSRELFNSRKSRKT